MGRLNDERAPYREAVAYDWAELLGFQTHGRRRAVIHYHDPRQKRQFTRKGLFLETEKSMGKRLKAREISIQEFAARQETGLKSEDVALYHFFQALIGNKDFILRVDQEPKREDNPIWGCGNTVVFEKDNGARFVVPYDFDLATFVSGEKKIADQWRLYPELGYKDESSSFLAWQLIYLKARVPKSAVLSQVAHLEGLRSRLEDSARKGLAHDPEGVQIALRHLNRFYKFLRPTLALPVIAQPNVPFYRHAKVGRSKLRPMPSDDEAFLRPGTPVRIQSRHGKWMRVVIYDFRWDLNENESTEGYIPASTLISDWAPEPYLAFQDDRDTPEPDSRRD